MTLTQIALAGLLTQSLSISLGAAARGDAAHGQKSIATDGPTVAAFHSTEFHAAAFGTGVAQAAISPDGARIAYQKKTDHGWRIFVSKIDGTDPAAVSTGPGDDVEPAWRPDGALIAFASSRAGRWDLYLSHPDGTSLRAITHGPQDARYPQWSPRPFDLAYEKDPLYQKVTDRSKASVSPSDLQMLDMLAKNSSDWSQYQDRFSSKQAARYYKLLFVQGKADTRQIATVREDGRQLMVFSTGLTGAQMNPCWDRTATRLGFLVRRGNQSVIYAGDYPHTKDLNSGEGKLHFGIDQKALRQSLKRLGAVDGPAQLTWVPSGAYLAVAAGDKLQLFPRPGLALRPAIVSTGLVAPYGFDWMPNARTALLTVAGAGGTQFQAVMCPGPLLDIVNAEDFEDLKSADRAYLSQNAFVAAGTPEKQMFGVYEKTDYEDLPIFITTDSLLHLHHLVFDYLLRGVESEHLAPDVIVLTTHYLQASLNQMNSASDSKTVAAAAANAAFFAVAARLVMGEVHTGENLPASPDPDDPLAADQVANRNRQDLKDKVLLNQWTAPLKSMIASLPPDVTDVADKEVALISGHAGPADSPIFGDESADAGAAIPVAGSNPPVGTANTPVGTADAPAGTATLPLPDAPAADAPIALAPVVSTPIGSAPAVTATADDAPTVNTKLDYSDFIPRGHYTRSEVLRRYFLLSHWLSAGAFRRTPELTRRALLLVSATDPQTMARWQKVEDTVHQFAGGADDQDLTAYAAISKDVYGGLPAVVSLQDADKSAVFLSRLAKLPLPIIAPSAGPSFRFLPAPSTPDAQIMQGLIYDGNPPDVGTKEQPRSFALGLDVMAVLGSDRAHTLLQTTNFQGGFFDFDLMETQYANYDPQFRALKAQFAGWSEADWSRSLYSRTLYAVLPLLSGQADAPANDLFAQTPAWIDKSLNTALGTWAELKHDVLPKQPVATEEGGEGGISESLVPVQPVGFVEPAPEVYRRLGLLVAAERQTLSGEGYLNAANAQRLETLASLLTMVQNLGQKQAAGSDLSPREIEQLRFFGGYQEHLTLTTAEGGEQGSTEGNDMAIVADVSSARSTKLDEVLALEEGVGRALPIYVAVPFHGHRQIACGAVFSYYEFTHPADDRLTDEKWRQLLDSADAPALPDWTKSFVSRLDNRDANH